MKIEDFNFAGHKAIVRVDFNVPLDENGNVTDDTRIRGALPTLKKVLADGGALIMMSHMGKPKGKVKPELSLSQIVKNVSDALGVEVKFAKDCGNADAEAAALKPDSICGDDFKNDCNTQVCPSNNIPDGWEGMDAGPETRKAFAAAIKGAKTILWNGPAGVFEFDNFAGGSKAIADAIAEATKEGAFSLIGGGDSVACINKFGLADQVSYISTGGGALLEAIEGKVLPGVAAIEK